MVTPIKLQTYIKRYTDIYDMNLEYKDIKDKYEEKNKPDSKKLFIP
jgi:hypothetical protein